MACSVTSLFMKSEGTPHPSISINNKRAILCGPITAVVAM